MIPLVEEKLKYENESYGCHEYYNQENDLKSRTTDNRQNLNQNQKVKANEIFGDLVDKPIAYFFAKIDEELKLKEKLVSLFRLNFSGYFRLLRFQGKVSFVM